MTRDVLRESDLAAFVTTPVAGGVVVFSGVVRNHHEGKAVERIEYSAVEPLALAMLEKLAAEVLADPEVERVAASHRVGLLEVGEASVMVAASSAHRDLAFRAARRLIDRIKEVLPVWKYEHFADGTREWVAGFEIAEGDQVVPSEVRGE